MRDGRCWRFLKRTVQRHPELHGGICPERIGILTPSSYRVLLVDDFEPWRGCAQLILGRNKRLQIVGEAADGSEAIRKSQELKPDLVLLDVGLPRVNGIHVAHQIGSLVPGAKVLFVSENQDADVVHAALSNGARGYVLKASAQTELLPAIEAVLMGETFVSRRLNHPPNGPF